MEAFRCAPLLALCSSPMGVLSAWAAPLFHCFLKPVSFWVCGARQGQCDRAHPASLGVWNGCPLKHSEQFAFQTSDTIIWGDHGSKLWVIISGTGALNRSDNATKILQKWGKIILPKTLFFNACKTLLHSWSRGEWLTKSQLHTNADTKLFLLIYAFLANKNINIHWF